MSPLKEGLTNRMNKNLRSFGRIKDWLSKEGQSEKKQGKYQYMIIVLCIGAALMLAGNLLFKKQTVSDLPAMKMTPSSSEDVPAFGTKPGSGNKAISDYEQEYESQLKAALDGMLGVKDVTVVVNVDGSGQNVLEENTNTKNQITDETDSNGGKRKVQDSSTDEQMVVIRNGDQETPVVVQTKKPQIRGVLVVAKGADNIEVKKMIVDAVTRALGVPSYRVAVVPKK